MRRFLQDWSFPILFSGAAHSMLEVYAPAEVRELLPGGKPIASHGCQACGRTPITAPDEYVVDLRQPVMAPISRGLDLTTYLYASSEFVDAWIDGGFTGLEFIQVKELKA
jgi:hypothetical protein